LFPGRLGSVSPRRFGSGALAVGALLLSSACSSTGPSETAAPPSTPTSQAAVAARPTAGATVTKLLVFVVENHSLDEMRSGMPFSYGLARRYGYATAYRAIAHPSLPDYLAIVGGSTFGVTADVPPSAAPIHGRSVFDQALGAGRTATVYSDGMPGTCATDNGGDRYAARHNAWVYFVDECADCARHDVPLTRLASDAAAGRLPNAGMVVPNLCHDAHDCGLDVADGWLRDQLGAVLAGPDWASGHLAVVVTADEDDRHQDNLVLTTVLHPGVSGVRVTSPLDHYSLTRLYDEVLGVAPLRAAATAPSMASAFGLRVPHRQ
jgi:phosphatidylinositol-3-phosphatase